MKVQASHYDYVEWNPLPLKPGEFINKPEKRYEVNISEDKKSIKVTSPCRVDVGLIDYSALKFTDTNDYKAGEMSFAGDVYTTVEVTLIDEDEILIDGDRNLLVEHIAKMMKGVTNYEGGFKVKLDQHDHQHIGLGSSAIALQSVGLAINKLFGSPMTNEELRDLIAYNFVEESDSVSELVFPGASTGGSFNTITNGGFVITSSDCQKIFHEDIPEDMRFVVGVPKVNVAGPEASETDVNCMSWERHNERVNAAKSCLWIMTEIMPYWVKGDYKKVGNAFYNYTFFGGKGMQMLFYRCGLHDTLFALKEAGIDGGWMTSAGPSLVAMTQDDNKTEIVKKIFKDRGFETILVVKGDNHGVKYEWL